MPISWPAWTSTPKTYGHEPVSTSSKRSVTRQIVIRTSGMGGETYHTKTCSATSEHEPH